MGTGKTTQSCSEPTLWFSLWGDGVDGGWGRGSSFARSQRFFLLSDVPHLPFDCHVAQATAKVECGTQTPECLQREAENAENILEV